MEIKTNESKLHAMMKKGPAKAVVSVALVGTLAMAGIGAYFTGTDTVENKFDISAGLTDKITVTEANWDTTDDDGDGVPDAAQHVVPLQTIAKDPVVDNKSDVEAWLFCSARSRCPPPTCPSWAMTAPPRPPRSTSCSPTR